MPRNGHGQTEEYKGGDKAEEDGSLSLSHSLCLFTSLLCAQQPNQGVRAVGGRFGFPLFALVSMTICHQSLRIKMERVSGVNLGREGVGKERASNRGGWKVGGLVGRWHHFHGMTMGAGQGPTWFVGVPLYREAVAKDVYNNLYFLLQLNNHKIRAFYFYNFENGRKD